MKIPNSLPQFQKEKTLIVVAGKQSGVIYLAYKGEIKEVDLIKIETPTYSDREGFFMTRTKTKVIRTGSVYEKNKQNLRKKFSKKFADALWDAVRKNKVENLQVCLSQHTAKEIMSEWLPRVRKLISKKVYGNYIELHPLDVLRRIEDKGFKVFKNK